MEKSFSDDQFLKLFPKLNTWDHKLFKKIYFKFDTQIAHISARIISFSADPRLWSIWLIIFGIYGLLENDFTYVVIFFFGFTQSFITYQILKKGVKRIRPFQQYQDITRHDKTGHGYSFPSGHVHHSTVLVILLGLVFFPKWWYFILIPIYHVFVALSRIINGCHYPIDTLFAIFEAYIEIFMFWCFTKNLYLQIFDYIWKMVSL